MSSRWLDRYRAAFGCIRFDRSLCEGISTFRSHSLHRVIGAHWGKIVIVSILVRLHNHVKIVVIIRSGQEGLLHNLNIVAPFDGLFTTRLFAIIPLESVLIARDCVHPHA